MADPGRCNCASEGRPGSVLPKKGFVVALVLLSGCFPHSCSRTESQALLPSDSLSRELAATTPVDSLALLWQVRSGELTALEYPRTIRWSPGGESLFVSDAGTGNVVAFSEEGRLVETVALPGVEHPYLLGWQSDTLVVLDPDERQLYGVAQGGTVWQRVVANDSTLHRALLYGATTPGGIVLKAVSTGRPTQLLFLEETGEVDRHVALNGPHWRHAGFLRSWGDSLISLCGYRPVVDVVDRDGISDTLNLEGFDSPMLNRSRLFVRGEVDQPPLLTSSAAPAGPYLFVLNLRPGWIQVDVYDHHGKLQRRLSHARSYRSHYYPVDLAVRKRHEGAYDIAIALVEPEPRIDLYRWHVVD